MTGPVDAQEAPGLDTTGGSETGTGSASAAAGAPGPAQRTVETVPGLAAARAERWADAMTQFLAGSALGLGVTRQAAEAWRRSWTNLRIKRFLAGALGLAEAGGALCDRPGAAAFAGVARGEFAGGFWQELPLYDLKVGNLAVTIPVLTITELAGGTVAIEATDIVAIEPLLGTVGTLTGLTEGVIGHVERLAADDPVRLHRSPLAWLKAGGSTLPSLAPAAAWMLNPDSPAGEELLLDYPLLCDDAAHAAEVYELQQAVRKRALGRARRAIGAGGKLFFAGPRGRA